MKIVAMITSNKSRNSGRNDNKQAPMQQTNNKKRQIETKTTPM